MGQRINVTFLHFDIELYEQYYDGTACSCDWLEIEGEKYCEEIPTPFTTITNTNNVDIKLISDYYDAGNRGYLAIWSATTEPPTSTSTRTRLVSFGQHSSRDSSNYHYNNNIKY